MKILIVLFTVALILAAADSASAQIERSTVRFGPNNQHSGYLVKPEGSGPFPALVVIHEWWGLNQNVKNEADRLAREGYVALAVDLFGKVAANPQEAQQLTRNLDQGQATAEMLAAANYLRSLPYVKRNRVGSIGWCFGGGQSLNLALNDPNLAAAVIYYGNPVTDPAQLKKIKAAVLGIFGEADASIPMSQVRAFEQGLKEANVRHEIYTYPGAGHAFANPSGGDRYNPQAAADAWKKTLAFLRKYLKQ